MLKTEGKIKDELKKLEDEWINVIGEWMILVMIENKWMNVDGLWCDGMNMMMWKPGISKGGKEREEGGATREYEWELSWLRIVVMMWFLNEGDGGNGCSMENQGKERKGRGGGDKEEGKKGRTRMNRGEKGEFQEGTKEKGARRGGGESGEEKGRKKTFEFL